MVPKSHLLTVGCCGIGKFRYIDIEKKFENIDYIENMQIRTELRKCRLVNIPPHKQQNKYIPRATTAKKTKLGETNRISKVYLLQYDHFMNVKKFMSCATLFLNLRPYTLPVPLRLLFK
jgi:hypothetical protein